MRAQGGQAQGPGHTTEIRRCRGQTFHRIRDYPGTLRELRHSYDLLMLKVLALLQDADPSLAKAITNSR